MQPFQRRNFIPVKVEQEHALAKSLLDRVVNGVTCREAGMTFGDALTVVRAGNRDLQENDALYVNDQYQVNVRDMGEMVHLSIKRLDKEAVHDWRDMQEIKNLLVGPECEGMELYPAESRLVDTANQYHLWVLKDPTARIPVGWDEGRVIDEDAQPGSNAKQRARKN